ncbi:competence type IV pilus minor pilin ComGF [Alkalicoccus luteus]|uniref:competence type IV pilus minor pilin ComGF n=1 Tax=Alkalicoccus luteus TaxID=1237094 RepID=UPI0040343D26
MIIILLFTAGYAVLVMTLTEEPGFHPYEFAVFSSQLEQEIKQADSLSVSPGGDRLVMTADGAVVTYEPYGSGIRRRVNYTGHQMMLQQVSSFTFTVSDESVTVAATGSGRTHRAALLYPGGLLHRSYQIKHTNKPGDLKRDESCLPDRNSLTQGVCLVDGSSN